MKYKYGDIADAVKGDIVEYIHSDTDGERYGVKGKQLCIVKDVNHRKNMLSFEDNELKDNGRNNYKLVLTKPGSEAKTGDTVISLTDMGSSTRMKGSVHKVISNSYGRLRYNGLNCHNVASKDPLEFKVLQQSEPVGVPAKQEPEKEAIMPKYKVGDAFTSRHWKSEEIHTIDRISNKQYYFDTNGGFDPFSDVENESNYTYLPDPLDIDYWQAKFKVGEDVWVKSKYGAIAQCRMAPATWTDPQGFYAYDPRNKPEADIRISNLCSEILLPTTSIATTTKENSMNTNKIETQNITVTMTAEEFAKHERKNRIRKSLSDFKARKKFTLVRYTEDGSYNGTTYFRKLSKAETAGETYLQNSPYGSTITIHKEISARKRKASPLVKA